MSLSLAGAQARAAGECQPLIDSCRSALQAKDLQIQAGADTLGQSLEQLKLVTGQRDDADAQLASWTRNPFTTGMIGVLVGALVTGYVLKK